MLRLTSQPQQRRLNPADEFSAAGERSGQQQLNRFGAICNVSEGFGRAARTSSTASLTNKHHNLRTFGERAMFSTSKSKLAHAIVVAGTVSLLLSSTALAGFMAQAALRRAGTTRFG